MGSPEKASERENLQVRVLNDKIVQTRGSEKATSERADYPFSRKRRNEQFSRQLDSTKYWPVTILPRNKRASSFDFDQHDYDFQTFCKKNISLKICKLKILFSKVQFLITNVQFFLYLNLFTPIYWLKISQTFFLPIFLLLIFWDFRFDQTHLRLIGCGFQLANKIRQICFVHDIQKHSFERISFER